MLPLIRQLFTPPIFVNEEDTRLAKFLHTLLITFFGGATLIALNRLLTGYANIAYALLITDIIVIGCLWLNRRGYTHITSLIILTVTLSIVTYFLYVGQGIHDIAIILYPIVIIGASILLELNTFTIYVLLTLFSVGLIVYLEINGYIHPAVPYTNSNDFIIVSIIIIITAAAIHLLTNDLTRSLSRAQQNEQALEKANRTLARRTSALQISEAKWRSLVENAPDHIFNVLRDGTILFANFNENMDLFIGRKIYDFIIPEHKEIVVAAITSVLQTGKPTEYIAQATLSENQVDWYATRVSPIWHGHLMSSLTLIATNISTQKATEADREALIHELEAKNAELERFTYTVSHDLKSPLVTVTGFLGFLEQDIAKGDTSRAQEDISHIRTAAENMGVLLADLLELSRIGRLVNPPQEVPFGDLVAEALQQVAGQVAQKGVTVTVMPDMPPVNVDRPRLVTAVQNLLDNAMKFMGGQPDPHIEVGIQSDGITPVFYVRDNGVGIDPQYHSRVFELFDRLHPQIEGTGIGLALVKRIVEVHNGRIWVESLGNHKGSTFCFTLNAEPSANQDRSVQP